MESILTSIKKLLGITEDYTHFDADIIMHINSAFMVLNQLGVGPEAPFVILDASSKWNDFIEGKASIEAVKACVYLRVRLLFDPPTSSYVLDSFKDQIAEYEWRLMVAEDPKEDDSESINEEV